MEPHSGKFEHYRAIAEKIALIVVFVCVGGWLGYLVGVQGLDNRLTEYNLRLAEVRAAHLEEIKRLQETQSEALAAVGRVVERTARTAERAADKADNAAAKADTAAGTAATAATTAKGAATRASRVTAAPAAPPAAAVNRTVREANRQLGASK